MAKEQNLIQETDPKRMFKDMTAFADTEKVKRQKAKEKAKLKKIGAPFIPGYEKEVTLAETTIKEKEHEQKRRQHNLEKQKQDEERKRREEEDKRRQAEERNRQAEQSKRDEDELKRKKEEVDRKENDNSTPSPMPPVPVIPAAPSFETDPKLIDARN